MLQLLFTYVVFSVTHSKLAKTKMVYPYNVGAQVAMDFTTFWVKKLELPLCKLVARALKV